MKELYFREFSTISWTASLISYCYYFSILTFTILSAFCKHNPTFFFIKVSKAHPTFYHKSCKLNAYTCSRWKCETQERCKCKDVNYCFFVAKTFNIKLHFLNVAAEKLIQPNKLFLLFQLKTFNERFFLAIFSSVTAYFTAFYKATRVCVC